MKRSKPLKRSKPIPRGKPPARSRKRIKFGNAYTRPEWRKLDAEAKKRSRGICEAQVCCDGNPIEGDCHHVSYAPFKGWKRLIVPLDQLLAVCHRCHIELERRKDEA